MSRISTKPAKRTAAEREADTIFSLKVQADRAARETKNEAFRAGMIQILQMLDCLDRSRALHKIRAKRQRPEKIYPTP